MSRARARTGSASNLRLGHLPEHGEEVGREVERVVGVDEGHADAEAVRGGRQRRHLGDQADDLLVAGLGVEDVLGVEIEGGQGGDGRDEHPHGMGVVVEALEEALADVLVDERVVGDVVPPGGELLLVGQLAVEEEVRHLEVGRALGQLLNGVAAVAQDPRIAVEVGDGALAGRRRHEAGIEEPDPGQELRPLLGRDPAVDDRNLNGLAIAIVRDRDALGHVKSPPIPDFGASRSYDHDGVGSTRGPPGRARLPALRWPGRPAAPAGAPCRPSGTGRLGEPTSTVST